MKNELRILFLFSWDLSSCLCFSLHENKKTPQPLINWKVSACSFNLSDQPVFFQRLCDSILIDPGRHFLDDRLQRRCAVPHQNAVRDMLQHWQIVCAVAEDVAVVQIHVVVFPSILWTQS